MSAGVPLPEEGAVEAMLAGLTGAQVSVQKADSAPAPDANAPAAEYVLGGGAPAAVAVVSLPLAVAASAALGMVPQPDEAEVKAMQAVPEHLIPNLRELANILAQLLNSDATPHVRFADLKGFGELSGDAGALAAEPHQRVDLAVELAGRSGTLSFLTGKLA